MEGLINLIILVLFIGIPVLVKIIEASKKKRPLPGPIPEVSEVPEEVWPELEIETQPEPEVKVKEPIKIPKLPETKPEVIISKKEPPTPPFMTFSRGDLQRGIILSAILGPPRCISKWKPFNC